MSITVTIYNDDAHGRDIQVVQINPFGGPTYPIRVQKANTPDGHGPRSEQYELKNGELLIVATAERES